MTEPKHSDEELDALAAETNQEIDAGQASKHLQDVFDEIHSTQGSAACTTIPPDLREQLERFCRAFQLGIADQLRGNARGLYVQRVSLDGFGRGFSCHFKDRAGRPFTVGITYDEGFAAAAQHGQTEMGRGMLDLVIGKLNGAYDRYFERMGS